MQFQQTRPPQKAQRSLLVKYSDKLVIIFEVMAFKVAFCSHFNSKSPNFSEMKTSVNASS